MKKQLRRVKIFFISFCCLIILVGCGGDSDLNDIDSDQYLDSEIEENDDQAVNSDLDSDLFGRWDVVQYTLNGQSIMFLPDLVVAKIFRDDGTGNTIKMNNGIEIETEFVWSTEGQKLNISISRQYDYEINGNTLKLSAMGDWDNDGVGIDDIRITLER